MITKDEVEKIVTTKQNGTRLCILTSRYYDSSLAYFLFLKELAKEDFPELLPSQIEIKRYAGRFRKGMCGIEFQVKCDTMPADYKEWSDHCILTTFPT